MRLAFKEEGVGGTVADNQSQEILVVEFLGSTLLRETSENRWNRLHLHWFSRADFQNSKFFDPENLARAQKKALKKISCE